MELQVIQQNALPVNPEILLKSIGNDRLVLVGDNTHGTTQFYNFRADITKHFIIEKGFTLIGIEWDWVDVARINEYVQGRSSASRAWDVISVIERFPEFLYENHPFEEFVEWLKGYNQTTNNKVNIYGLDIFGFLSTLRYLMFNLPDQQDLLQQINSIFSRFADDEYAYGYAVQSGAVPSLESLVGQLKLGYGFFLNQCIMLLKEGEEYYRKKATNDSVGWNLRDRHMCRIIIDILNNYGGKMVGWLHNTHTGDVTYVKEFQDQRKISAMTLLKEQLGDQVYGIGLLTYTGTVTASDHWYGPTMKFNLNPAIPGSYSQLFHTAMGKDFMLIPRGSSDQELLNLLSQYRYERFIGGAYNPSNELRDHYVKAKLYPQFDAIVFFDKSNSF